MVFILTFCLWWDHGTTREYSLELFQHALYVVEDAGNQSLVPVKVLDDRHILYGNETTSVSALAQRLKGFTHPVQGTLWFKYNGEGLNNLRERLGK